MIIEYRYRNLVNYYSVTKVCLRWKDYNVIKENGAECWGYGSEINLLAWGVP
jgi:hypothetical protein